MAFGSGPAVGVGPPCRSPVGGIDRRVWLDDEPEVAGPGRAGAAAEGIAGSAAALAVTNAGMRPPMVNAVTRAMVSGIGIRSPNNGDLGEDEASSDGVNRTRRRTTDTPTDRSG